MAGCDHDYALRLGRDVGGSTEMTYCAREYAVVDTGRAHAVGHARRAGCVRGRLARARARCCGYGFGGLDVAGSAGADEGYRHGDGQYEW